MGAMEGEEKPIEIEQPLPIDKLEKNFDDLANKTANSGSMPRIKIKEGADKNRVTLNLRQAGYIKNQPDHKKASKAPMTSDQI